MCSLKLILVLDVLQTLIDLKLILTSLLTSLILLEIETDEILACHIKTIQMINCIFGTVYVFIDNKSSPLGLGCVALPDLAYAPILPKYVIEFVRSDLVR